MPYLGPKPVNVRSASSLIVDGNLTAGQTALENGLTVDKDGNTVATFDRATSDGAIIDLQKDGTTVGSVGTAFGELYITDGSSGLRIQNGEIKPVNSAGAGSDNTINLGSSSHRFKDLYLSGGVYLGGTGADNQLDDYEEGTFTPTIGGTSALGTTTYSEQAGVYTKIGNMVRFSGSIQFSGHSGSSGNMAISLPFATGGASWQGNITLGYQGGFSAIGYTGYADPGRSDFFIRKDGTNSTTIVASEIPSGGHVIFGGTFVTTA